MFFRQFLNHTSACASYLFAEAITPAAAQRPTSVLAGAEPHHAPA
jgi:hypothetical protein